MIRGSHTFKLKWGKQNKLTQHSLHLVSGHLKEMERHIYSSSEKSFWSSEKFWFGPIAFSLYTHTEFYIFSFFAQTSNIVMSLIPVR